ncbi:MAG: ankyrin repeat domain-containing protein [Thermoguttaceae bacterium]
MYSFFALKRFSFITLFLIVTMCTGCNGAFTSSWYSKFNWKAEDYFDDPKVIALCKAIETKDLKEIDRLVAEGANVNAKGKGNMTPLLWAFPENKPEVFKRILEHGADPNVEVASDFNTKNQGIRPGDSVLHLAAGTAFPDYFKYVMQHDGNPNLIRGNKYKDSPLITVISGNSPDKKECIKMLIDAGADLDYENALKSTALMQAVSWIGQYDLAIQLLDAGALYTNYREDYATVLHDVIFRERELSDSSDVQRLNYETFVKMLRNRGADLEQARKDETKWAGGGKPSLTRVTEIRNLHEKALNLKKKKEK